MLLVFLGFGGGWSVLLCQEDPWERVCHCMQLCDSRAKVDAVCVIYLETIVMNFLLFLFFVLNFQSFCDVGVVGFCGGWSHLFIVFKA